VARGTFCRASFGGLPTTRGHQGRVSPTHKVVPKCEFRTRFLLPAGWGIAGAWPSGQQRSPPVTGGSLRLATRLG
jgi:hypothetical protein